MAELGATGRTRGRRVFLRELALDARIGVHPHEMGGSQPILVSLDMWVVGGAAGSDVAYLPAGRESDPEMREVVCYEMVANVVRGIVEEGHVDLVETLVERIASTLLRDARIVEVRVLVEKLRAIPGAAAAGVEIHRAR